MRLNGSSRRNDKNDNSDNASRRSIRSSKGGRNRPDKYIKHAMDVWLPRRNRVSIQLR